jgi:hypothetical protein
MPTQSVANATKEYIQMKLNRNKDYFADMKPTLTPYRHNAVKEIANRICAARDELTSEDQVSVQTVLWNKGTPIPFFVRYDHSNLFIYEKVDSMLPKRLKGLLFILVVLAGERFKGRHNRAYDYIF